MMDGMTSVKASFMRRKSNFTFTETDRLLSGIELRKKVILTPSAYQHAKRIAWQKITTSINDINEGDERTVEEVRKKWNDMVHHVKRKYAKGSQDFNDIEMRVLALKLESKQWFFTSDPTPKDDSDVDVNFLLDGSPASPTPHVQPSDIVQIKQEKIEDDYDHPPVHFDGCGNGNIDNSNDNSNNNSNIDDNHADVDEEYPETPFPYDPKTRKRKTNFSSKERSIMLQGIKKRRSVILCKLQDTGMQERKRNAWEEICEEINNVGKGSYRTVEDVRKKWNDMQSLARRKRKQVQDADAPSVYKVEPESESEDAPEYDGGDLDYSGEETKSNELETAGDDGDFLEQVMSAKYYNSDDDADKDFEDDADDDNSNDSNYSEWVPGSKRKSRSSLNSSKSTKVFRKGNFSPAETTLMLDEVYRRRKIIFSSVYDRQTGERKRIAWSNIASYLNTVCGNEKRTLFEVRKKWSDLFTRASKYRAKLEDRGSESEEVDVKLSDVHKVNERVLYIYDQRNEGQEQQLEDEYEEDIESEAIKTISSLLEVKDNEDGSTEESPIMIQNVLSIDEQAFLSLGDGPPKKEKTTDDTGIDREPCMFRRKKGPFTDGETKILLQEMKNHKCVLLTYDKSAQTKLNKLQAWKNITERINCDHQGVPRSMTEIQKKWYDLKRIAFNKQARRAESAGKVLPDVVKLVIDAKDPSAHVTETNSSKLMSILNLLPLKQPTVAVSSDEQEGNDDTSTERLQDADVKERDDSDGKNGSECSDEKEGLTTLEKDVLDILRNDMFQFPGHMRMDHSYDKLHRKPRCLRTHTDNRKDLFLVSGEKVQDVQLSKGEYDNNLKILLPSGEEAPQLKLISSVCAKAKSWPPEQLNFPSMTTSYQAQIQLANLPSKIQQKFQRGQGQSNSVTGVHAKSKVTEFMVFPDKSCDIVKTYDRSSPQTSTQTEASQTNTESIEDSSLAHIQLANVSSIGQTLPGQHVMITGMQTKKKLLVMADKCFDNVMSCDQSAPQTFIHHESSPAKSCKSKDKPSIQPESSPAKPCKSKDNLELARLKVERKRLAIEKKRLNIEQEKLRLFRRLVQLEEAKATNTLKYIQFD